MVEVTATGQSAGDIQPLEAANTATKPLPAPLLHKHLQRGNCIINMTPMICLWRREHIISLHDTLLD